MKKLRSIFVLAVLLFAGARSFAQAVPDNTGQAATNLPTILQNVTFRPELNAQMPLETAFTDESGKSVQLAQYFHQQKPVLVAFVYYGCPMLCTQLEQGVVGSLRMLSFNPGRDYGVEFPGRDLRLGLVDASQGKIGTPVDKMLLFCFQYDPSTARYSATILSIMRLMAVGTVAGLLLMILIFRRRDKRAAQANLSHQGAD